MAQVAEFDIITQDRLPLTLSFIIEQLQEDGTSHDPVEYFDFTGKRVYLEITGNYPEPFSLQTENDPTDNGSLIVLKDDDSGFDITISATDIALASKTNGKYFIGLLEEGLLVQPILVRGAFKIESLNAGGTI